MNDQNGNPQTQSINTNNTKPAGRCIFSSILHELASESRRVTFAPGSIIHEPQARADFVHIIHRGQVRIYQVGEAAASRLCEILGPDEWFGVAALAQSETYGVRAVAVGQTVVTEVRADRLLAAMAKQPGALIELTRQIAARVLIAREESAELMFRDTNQRLVNALRRFANSAASTQMDDGGVVLNITHSQLAQAVGAARETISLALTQLRHQNLVRTGRNQLFFNPDALGGTGASTPRSTRRLEQSIEQVA